MNVTGASILPSIKSVGPYGAAPMTTQDRHFDFFHRSVGRLFTFVYKHRIISGRGGMKMSRVVT
jgi:hypothetical protein